MERYELGKVWNTISDMNSGEKIHLDEYLGDVVLEITKDSEYNYFRDTVVRNGLGKDVFNVVTVDFQLGGKSIASTDDIHVNDLEDVLNDIRNGDTTHLIDEDKPLGELVKAAEKSKNKVDRDDR